MGYNKLDKINALTALALNNGNKRKTALEMGVNRKTLIAWEMQLQEDNKLKIQVDAHCRNIANYEEMNALKAISEISRRLDREPEKVGIGDLIKVKDTSIHNARLIRGDSTQNTAVIITQHQMALQFIAECRKLGKTTAEIIEALDRQQRIDRSVREDAILALGDGYTY